MTKPVEYGALCVAWNAVRPFALAAAILLASLPSPYAAAQTPPLVHGLDIAIEGPVAPVRFAHGEHIIYEVHATNFASTPIELFRVEPLDASSGAVLAVLDGEALVGVMGRVGGAVGDAPRVIAPGARAILYLDVAIAERPLRVRHRIAFARTVGGEVQHAVIEGAEAALDARAPLVLTPPLRGGPWVAVYNSDWERGHRRVYYAIGGRARIQGRFAIDWFWAGPGDGRKADVLAVADAMVAAVRDDFADDGETGGRLEDGAGNYVVLDLGDGRFAFYEHLASGVRVRAGERVRRGQIIAALGATGHVSGPHLHFHVGDAAKTLEEEGLPYVLEEYRVLGRYAELQALRERRSWSSEGIRQEVEAFPASLSVVEFATP